MDTNKYSRELAVLAQAVPADKRIEFLQLASKSPSLAALKNSKAYQKLTKKG